MEKSQLPSTSKVAVELDGNDNVRNSQDGDALLPPTIKDEEAEITRLENEINLTADAGGEQSDCEKRIKFQCSSCGLAEFVQCYSKNPDFSHGIQFLEDTYVMRDPFKPPPPRWKPLAEYFIAVGANCSECNASVCHDNDCSFFYTRTFCLSCAERQLKSLPPEAQLKLRKQLQTRQTK